MSGTNLEAFYPFASGAGSNVSAAQWRRYMGNCPMGRTGVVRGVASEFHVIQRVAGANMSVDVGGGEARILGHLGYQSGGVSALNIGIDANPSGNPRIDVIVLRADFVNQVVVYDVLKGVPAVSPVATALTQDTTMWEISLAQIAVAAGATSIVTGNITDTRRWANATLWTRDYAISGTQATPSGATNYLNPVLFQLEPGWSAVIDRAAQGIRGGTSAAMKWQKSATINGAAADVTGLTSITASTTRALTQLATSAEVAIVDQSQLYPVITTATGSPDNLEASIGGWKWPTPALAT